MAASEFLHSASFTMPVPQLTTSTFPPYATGTSDQRFVTDSDKPFFNAVLATNSISVAACLFVITAYFFLRRKYPQVMSRASLKLSIAMACSDTIYHSANLAGYGNLPTGFICAFVGGWLFTTPCFLSTFYACAIALNTQLVFVHGRIPNTNKQKLYLIIPPILAILISTPTLIAGVYGFDDIFHYCWYTTHNLSNHTVLVRIVMTWSLWLSIALVYLISAVILITCSLFSKTGPLSRFGNRRYLQPGTSQVHSTAAGAGAAVAMGQARRDIARRALTVRVLGYISVPVICVFPGVIIDFIARGRPDVYIPPVVPLIAAITAGLMGTFNAVLISFDPSVVAVVFWPHWKKRKRQARLRRNRMKAAAGQLPELQPPTPKSTVLDDIEMAQTKVVGEETQGLSVTTIHFQDVVDHGLESHGESVKTVDIENSKTSTTDYNICVLVETYHGL